MDLADLAGASPLGAGVLTGPGSLTDPALAATLSSYKRTIASRYTTLRSDELGKWLTAGPFEVSRKIDGELWFLIIENGDAVLASPRGKVISGELPVLDQARAASSRACGRVVIPGELHGQTGEGRARVGDLASVMAGGKAARTDKIAFAAFDLVTGGTKNTPETPVAHSERHALLQTLLGTSENLIVVETDSAEEASGVEALYQRWVIDDGDEGLIVRGVGGRIYKVKPSIDIDAAVIAYSVRAEDSDQCRSLLLALIRPDGRFQVFGSVGNIPAEIRRELVPRLDPLRCDSTYRRASSDGALYRFVKPEVVVQIRVTDIQGESSSGDPIRRMVLEHDGRWSRLREMPGASPIHPVLERIRNDKQVNETDVRFAQVLDRCPVRDLDTDIDSIVLPASEILRREVYTKKLKGGVGVRKLLVWQSNKQDVDPRYPAFVLHWTDYSPGRKDPIKREVELAPTREKIFEAADSYIAANIKRGWDRVDA